MKKSTLQEVRRRIAIAVNESTAALALCADSQTLDEVGSLALMSLRVAQRSLAVLESVSYGHGDVPALRERFA